jgi:hypothetical protein
MRVTQRASGRSTTAIIRSRFAGTLWTTRRLASHCRPARASRLEITRTNGMSGLALARWKGHRVLSALAGVHTFPWFQVRLDQSSISRKVLHGPRGVRFLAPQAVCPCLVRVACLVSWSVAVGFSQEVSREFCSAALACSQADRCRRSAALLATEVPRLATS